MYAIIMGGPAKDARKTTCKKSNDDVYWGTTIKINRTGDNLCQKYKVNKLDRYLIQIA